MDWSRTHNSTFELDKTALVDFSRSKTVPRPPISIGSQIITPVESHVLLGVAFDQGLRWQVQCNRALAKGMKWASQLNRLSKMAYGAPAHILKRLYLSVAVPRFSYAADIWYRPVTLGEDGKSNSGAIGMAKRLGRIQHTAARVILGAMRSTPTSALDAHAGLLPMHLLLNEVCERAAIRLATLPPEHPLAKSVSRCIRGRASHVPPLQSILHYSGHLPDEYDNVPIVITHRARNLPRLAFPNRLSATMNAHTDHTYTQVFADGSAGPVGVGAAAVRYTGGNRSAVAGKRLGKQGEVSVLDAEIVGIWMAAHLVLKSPEIVEAIIYTDSQLAIRALEGEKVGASPSLVNSASLAIRNARRRVGGISVRLGWCPGHGGLRGSDEADREARAAARGLSNGQGPLPGKVARFKPRKNPKTSKEAMKTKNLEQAKAQWCASTFGTKHRAKYPKIVAHEFIDNIKHLSRAKAALLFQFSVGHAPLQAHLFRLRVVDTGVCPSCGDAPETVAHYLLRCRTYAAERHRHLSSNGLEFLNLSFLFSSPRALSPLFRFVEDSDRFPGLIR